MKTSRKRLERMAIFRELSTDEQAELLKAIEEDDTLRQAWTAYQRQDEMLGNLSDPLPDPHLRSAFYEVLDKGGPRPSWMAVLGQALETGGRVALAVAGVVMIVAAALIIRGQMVGSPTGGNPPQDQGTIGRPAFAATPTATPQEEDSVTTNVQEAVAPYPPPPATPTPLPYHDPYPALLATPTLLPYQPPVNTPEGDFLAEGWHVATPVSDPQHIRLAGWSPDSRFLAYWQIDSESVEVNPQYPAGVLTFLNVISGETCTYDRALYAGADGEVWRHGWLDDGRLLVFNEDGSYAIWRVCSGAARENLGSTPATVERIVASGSDGQRWLLLADDAYMIATLQEDTLTFATVSDLSPTPFDAAAFSPDNTMVAIHHSAGGTYVVDVERATVVRTVEWTSGGGLGNIFEPVWLDALRLMVRSSADAGALLIEPDGDRIAVGPDLLGHEPSTGFVSEGAALRDGGFAIAGYYMPGSEPFRQGVWYVAGNGEVQELPRFDRATFTPNGERLLLFVESDGTAGAQNEVWWADTSETPLTPQLLYEGFDFPYSATSEQDRAVSLSVGNDLYILTDTGDVSAQKLIDVIYGDVPMWSPNGEYIALAGGFSGRADNLLYVIAVP